jgi:hypothetical protein
LFDLDATLSYYHQPLRPEKEIEYERTASVYACAINGDMHADKISLLRRLRRLHGNEGYQLPNITRMMITTRHLEQTYRDARQAYLKKRNIAIKIPDYYLICRDRMNGTYPVLDICLSLLAYLGYGDVDS